jgi:hypothetical protein
MQFFKRQAMLVILLGFGTLNAILYSSLLPLWEGFDEPFHYCYVQDLSVQRRWPVLGKTLCSQEVGRSLELVPVSHIVRQNMPWLTTFQDYFRLSPEQRRMQRQQLYSLPEYLKYDTTRGLANYEAQQAPLAYLLLAVPDHLWRAQPIPERVKMLRILAAVFAVVATALLTFWLARMMGLAEPFPELVVFLALSTQMFYGATAHITNDWLAIPLAILLFVTAGFLYNRADTVSASLFALTLGAGLMTKAYFLTLVPLAFGLVTWLAVKKRLPLQSVAVFSGVVFVVVGPWYWRNQMLYQSLSATQQSASGLGLPQALWALPRVRWITAIATLMRTSLWTGNNSDTAFSLKTIALMWTLLLVVVGLCIAGSFKQRPRFLEKFIVTGSAFHIAGIFYAVALLYVFTKGTSRATGQWYTQPIFAPLLCVAFCGACRFAPRLTRVVAALMVWVWAYVISATYLLKLIPMYGGWGQGPVRLRTLIGWYDSESTHMAEILGNVSLASAHCIVCLSVAVSATAFTIAALVCVHLRKDWHNERHRKVA